MPQPVCPCKASAEDVMPFFDADGDLGHEFYEETVGGLRRVLEGLVRAHNSALYHPCFSAFIIFFFLGPFKNYICQ